MIIINNDTVGTDDGDELQLPQKVEIGFLVLVLLVGGPLNIVSFVRTVKAFRATRVKSQILLLRMNLNVADLITLFVYVPRQIIWMLTYQWYGGDILCRIGSFFSTFSFYLNSFVVASIAVDRVFGAYHMSSVNANRTAYSRCRKMIVVGWIFAAIFSLPQAYIFQVMQPFPQFMYIYTVRPKHYPFRQCVPLWTVVAHESNLIFANLSIPDSVKEVVSTSMWRFKSYEQIYSMIHILFVFWIPCVVIIISYILVLLILQGHLRSLAEYSTTSSASVQPNDESTVMIRMREESSYGEAVSCAIQPRASPRFGPLAANTIYKAKQHAIRQAALIIVAYLTFWTPYQSLSLLNTLNAPAPRSEWADILNAVICANSIVNPIIYGVFGKHANRK